MPKGTTKLAKKITPPRHKLWANIETVIKTQCKGTRKPPGFKYSSTRTYRIPATNSELTVQVYPTNCMISHEDIVFDDIPRDQILHFLKAFIAEKKLIHTRS